MPLSHCREDKNSFRLKNRRDRISSNTGFLKKLEKEMLISGFPHFQPFTGEKVEIRIFDPSTGLRSFERLGLADREFGSRKSSHKRSHLE